MKFNTRKELKDAIKKQYEEHPEYIDVTGWNVSNIEDMSSIFQSLTSVEQIIGLETWDVSNVKDMRYMFDSCPVGDIPLRYDHAGSIILSKKEIINQQPLLTNKEYKRCLSLLYKKDNKYTRYLLRKINLKRMFDLSIEKYLNKNTLPEPLLKNVNNSLKLKPHTSVYNLKKINYNIEQITDMLLLTQYSKLYTGMQLPPLTIEIFTEFDEKIKSSLNVIAYYDAIETNSRLNTIEGVISNCRVSSKEIDIFSKNVCINTICYIGLNKIILNVAKRDRKLRKQLKKMFSLIKKVNPLTYDNLIQQLKTMNLYEEENYGK